jgi:hypothetical protein
MPNRLQVLNTRVLTSVLLVGLPVLVVGTAVVLSIGQARLKDAQTQRLTEMAEYIASSTDAHMFRSILDGAVLARVPELREVAAAGSARPFDQRAAETLDRDWHRDSAATAKRLDLLNSAASRFLADLSRNDPVLREILVTDRFGRLVAASNVTSDYLQADEAWWSEAFDQGRGRIAVGDVKRDESAGVYAFEIAVPISSGKSEAIDGVLKIVADSREMLAGIGGAEFGSTSEAMLVRSNGSIVFARRPHGPDDRFFGSELLREHLEAQARRKEAPAAISFDATDQTGTERRVVLAPSQLARSYPTLDWYVALSIERDELLAPFQSLIWYLMLTFALTAIAVLAIALWLSLRLAAPTFDPAVDMHLVDHPSGPVEARE